MLNITSIHLKRSAAKYMWSVAKTLTGTGDDFSITNLESLAQNVMEWSFRGAERRNTRNKNHTSNCALIGTSRNHLLFPLHVQKLLGRKYCFRLFPKLPEIRDKNLPRSCFFGRLVVTATKKLVSL